MKAPLQKVLLALSAIGIVTAGAAIAQFAPPGGGRPGGPPAPGPATTPIANFGGPLIGLNAQQRAAFEEGAVEFRTQDTPETGLGPIFNGRSCAECHSGPALGGGSNVTVTRFGRVNESGQFDPLLALGGSLLQRFAINNLALERVPAEANVIAQRKTTPLFGAGLIEAIPDQAILAAAARPQADGISGRAALITDPASGQMRVGRFGWKAQHASLLSFSADAYLNEMGITNRFFPTENAPNGNQAVLARFDRVPGIEDAVDPETGRSDIDAFTDFMRFLAAPPRLVMSASARAGESVFATTGCGGCHTPSLATGNHPVPALSNQVVNLYSDLLLHDMGSLGDGIVQGPAAAREMRTAPLWGVRARAPYLHDGRAPTLDAAIRAHDGEAVIVRNRYLGLTPAARQQLLDFLGTL
ncbi:MAG: hypothetical protein JNM76_10545 [Betaproteobacteria bacterium]|nr:hypothetical protein [Betaproteobacteria bacterium]